VVFPAGQVHGWQEGARQPFDLLAVNLSAKIRLPSSALRLPTVLLKVDGDPAVLTLAGELERAGLSSRPGRNVLGAALALALRHALAQAAADASAAVPSEATRLVHKATEFMRMNLNRPLGQPELATALGVSSVRLARVFLRETGKSPVATLRQLRLAEVRRLLVETTLPLEAIALRTGLHGAQHLCRTFRRGTGLTPGAYRAGHRHAG
jgi:AraC-like DNA-binding protein